MSVADFISYLEDLRQTEKTEYAKNAHKPFAAYQKHLKANGNLAELYVTLNTVYKRFSEKYAPTTVRNYMRYLQASLNLDKIKTALDKDILKIAQRDLQEILRECDKIVHVDKVAEKSTVVGEYESVNELESAGAEDQESEIVEDNWDLNEIQPAVIQDSANVDAKHQAEIYKAQLECMWRLLELVFKK